MEDCVWTEWGVSGGRKMGKQKRNMCNIKKDMFAQVAAVLGNKDGK